MSKDPRTIILSPVRTEKTEDVISKGLNKYYFRVARTANKIEIGKAAEELFKVKVIKCETMNVKGKVKRWGRTSGKRASWKKAILTLKEGDTIKLFEGV